MVRQFLIDTRTIEEQIITTVMSGNKTAIQEVNIPWILLLPGFMSM